jgi:lipoprotein-anchoring transpeptidase ErfK/SrfK
MKSKPHRRALSPLMSAIGTAVCSAALALCATAASATPVKGTRQSAPSVALIDVDAFNTATDMPLLKTGSRGPAVARAQILLDRVWYSSGEIDGRFAANMQRIVRAFQTARGLKVTGQVTPETWQALREDGAPLLVRYTINDKDAAGPFQKLPADLAMRAELKAQPYESLDESLAERFHTSIAFLRQLNRAGKIEGAAEIVVPNVARGKPPSKAVSIEVRKGERVLYVLDVEKRPVAAFPISIGNEKSDPLPIGVMAIKNEVSNPSFTYDPALLKNQPPNAKKMEISPGPNNPIGNVWLGLTKPHWGIHGTAEPSNVGHSETNGCIHLTNWDAQRLSTLVKAGFKVDVRP